ncbi:inorganic phosphate transporter, partial [[Kitasatospora] papulosa]
PWGVAVVAVLLVAGSGAIWLLSRRKPVDHTNVNATGDEPAGVVTTAIAAVSPPPAGLNVPDLKTTIHAPTAETPADRPATV